MLVLLKHFLKVVIHHKLSESMPVPNSQVPRGEFPLFCLAFLVDPLSPVVGQNPAVEMIKTSYWDIH